MKIKVLILIACFLLFACVNVMAGDFTDNADGTVTDNNTGLMWQKSEPGELVWENALTYCEGLSLSIYDDWRLPNIKEIESIIDDNMDNPAIDTNFFPDAYTSNYWSSTTDANGSWNAWRVHFLDGFVDCISKTNNFYVRCVRGVP